MTDSTIPSFVPVARRSLFTPLLTGVLASCALSEAAETKHAIFVPANESRFPDHRNTCKLSAKGTQGVAGLCQRQSEWIGAHAYSPPTR